MCFVCLQKHAKNECKGKYNRKICGNKHNVLLHLEKKIETKALIATTVDSKNDNNNESVEPITTNEQNVSTLIAATRDEDNLLATAMVRVLTKDGNKILVRAVIDMGSQSAMINEHMQQSLGLNGEKIYWS